MELPYLVVSDGAGNIFEIKDYYMACMALSEPLVPEEEDLIRIPYGSNLLELPGRIPIGYDPEVSEFVQVPEYKGNPVVAVSAFMAPAYVQLYRCAFLSLSTAPRLPLFSYTSLGWSKGAFFAAGIRIDPDTRQDLRLFDNDVIECGARKMLDKNPDNRLIHHLMENCVLRYGCPAARNLVMGRWECPVPTSPGCNANCIGCISKQPLDSCVPASQERIGFSPTVKEILEVCVPHLERAERPVISFGQGCEGEPLMAGDLIEEAIREIRKRTNRGIININTNGSRPEAVERLCKAGLDSIRVSLNSAQKRLYEAYFRPSGYAFENVCESLRIVRHFGLWSSINYFIFPGLTDHPREGSALEGFIRDTGINMIQARNINIDPEWYMDMLGLHELPCEYMGIRNWIYHIREVFPWIKFGYFNPPRVEMKDKYFPSYIGA